VHLLESDDARMGEVLLERYTEIDRRGPGWRFMRNTGGSGGDGHGPPGVGGGRCAGLDVSRPGHFPCAVYERRPEDCRIVEPGSPCCLEARRLGHLGTSVEFKRVDRA
jgi:hypothetical protein